MHERKPNRLQGYDYSTDNLYFVTSCVHNRICCFGQPSEQQMILNEYGKIAEKQWYWLADQYPYVVLHEFIVMPNHIHGIIEIDHMRVRESKTIKIKSLSELMGAYKTTVSKQIHLIECTDSSRPVYTFKWQRSFHDSIIRDEGSFQRISNYIVNNPKNWKQDNFYNI